MGKKKGLDKIDMYILIVLILVSILIKIPFIDYPIAGDSTVFLNLAESMYQNQTYNYQGEPHTQYPPLWPLTITLFMPLTENPVLAIKIAGMIISTAMIVLIYIISKKLGLKYQAATVIASLLMFNPIFQYFGGGYFNVAESIGTLLFILAGYFFITRDNNRINKYVFALTLGLSMLAKVDMLFFSIPFLAYYVYMFFKNKDFELLLVPVVAVFPLALWILRNLIIIGNAAGKGYDATLGMSIINVPESTLRLLIAGFLTLTFLTPFIVFGLKKYLEKDVTKFWTLFITGLVLHVALFITIDSRLPEVDFFGFTIMRTRRYVLALPWLTFIGVSSVKFLKPNVQKIAKILLIIMVPVFFMMMALYNYGSVQDAFGEPLGSTYSLRSYHRAEAINWLNNNLANSSILVVSFNEGMDYRYIGKHFREDIDYYYETIPPKGSYYLLSDSDLSLSKHDGNIEKIKSIKTTAVYKVDISKATEN